MRDLEEEDKNGSLNQITHPPKTFFLGTLTIFSPMSYSHSLYTNKDLDIFLRQSPILFLKSHMPNTPLEFNVEAF